MTRRFVLFDSLAGPHWENVTRTVEERKQRDKEAREMMDARTPLERARDDAREFRDFYSRVMKMAVDTWRPRILF